MRTIAGVGLGADRLAARDDRPSTISSRVDPPGEAEDRDRPDAVLGRVIDDRGVPVANARVRLAVDGAPGGREVVGTTNRSGQFLLKGLRPGDEYTLIAEWDDGEEFLLGRSSVAAPSEEVRIRVASVEGSDRIRLSSSDRAEGSRAASYSRDDRDRPPAPDLDDHPGSSRMFPDADDWDDRAEDDPAPTRNRSGWTPTDSVRRASHDPSASSGRTERSFDPEDRDRRPVPDVEEGRSADRPRPRPIRESDDLHPDEFPLPMASIGEDRGTDREPSPVARPSEPPREPREDRPAERPRTTAGSIPTVRTFEPESERDRDRPDPPLMRSAPPEPEPDDERRRDDRSGGRPGSMQFSERPAPLPTPEIEPGPEPAPGPEDRPHRDLDPDPGPEDPFSEPMADPGPEDSFPAPMADPGFEDPIPEPLADASPRESRGDSGPIESEALASLDPFSGVSGPSDRAVPPSSGWPEPEPDSDPETEAGPTFEEPDRDVETRLASEGSQSVRWADLPAPARVEPDREEQETGRGGGRWPFGLLRRASRDRDDPDDGPAFRPVAQFDADRERLDDFLLPDLRGNPYRLRGTSSEYVLLCFWGSWCDPCVAALPHLNELQRQFGPDRLQVISIAYQRDGEGGPKALNRVNRRLGLSFPILLAPADEPCPVAEAMDVRYYPTLILIDREGRVVHRETGATSDKLMRLDRAIAAALDESVLTMTRR